MKNYGFSETNPIKLKCSESALVMLDNIVTSMGFHILYHFTDYFVTGDSIIEKFEIFSEDKDLQTLYFEITNNKNIWIPPSGFLFKDEYIIAEDFIYHGLDYYYKEEQDYEKTVTEFEMLEETYFELFVFENVGVNYKSQNFPYSMYQKYIEEHTYRKED